MRESGGVSGVMKPDHLLSKKSLAMREWQHARYAERVKINGLLIHPDAPHGRLRSYTTYGCRGPLCYATQKHYSITGENSFPGVGATQCSVEDCVTFQSDVYPDRRRR